MNTDNRNRGLAEMRNKIVMRHHAAGRCPKDIARRMRNTIYGKQLTEGRIRAIIQRNCETPHECSLCGDEEQEQETNWETSNNNENYSDNEHDSYQ